MEKLVSQLQKDFPALTFKPAKLASWSPKHQRIGYVASKDPVTTWALLHELGHAISQHTSYCSDIALLKKEAEAWQAAVDLATKYGITITDDHIQDCLDTYRDWVYRRSTCPTCESHGIQLTEAQYRCYNCTLSWNVSNRRFCRPYRAIQTT